MADEQIEFGSNEWGDIMDMVYGNDFHKFIDLIERNDIFSVSGERGLNYLGDKLELTQSSHVLDLCSGMGGPARYLARKYGCRVTGVDISESSHHAAQKRTKEAGLDHLISFVHGNALDMPFPDQSFTHVIGCDAWLYFPDKVQLYKAAYRVLKSEGIISFLEAATDMPKKLHFEDNIGKCYIESIVSYASKLEAVGFNSVRHYNITDITCKEIADVIYKIIIKKDETVKLFGSTDFYFINLEFWAECLAYLGSGEATQCCFMARKE